MSKHKEAVTAGNVSVESMPYGIRGKTHLIFSYTTKRGIYKELRVMVDVADVLCISETMQKVKAKYKQHATELAAKL